MGQRSHFKPIPTTQWSGVKWCITLLKCKKAKNKKSCDVNIFLTVLILLRIVGLQYFRHCFKNLSLCLISSFLNSCLFVMHLQNVIPQQLLDQYLSMTDPARAQTVDTEIAKHCAFSLPGVALTLGRQNWHCLKDTYETLASDVQVGSGHHATTETERDGVQLVQLARSHSTPDRSSFLQQQIK